MHLCVCIYHRLIASIHQNLGSWSIFNNHCLTDLISPQKHACIHSPQQVSPTKTSPVPEIWSLPRWCGIVLYVLYCTYFMRPFRCEYPALDDSPQCIYSSPCVAFPDNKLFLIEGECFMSSIRLEFAPFPFLQPGTASQGEGHIFTVPIVGFIH